MATVVSSIANTLESRRGEIENNSFSGSRLAVCGGDAVPTSEGADDDLRGVNQMEYYIR